MFEVDIPTTMPKQKKAGIKDASLSLNEIEGDVLAIRYVPLSMFDGGGLDAMLFDQNPKLHDIGAISRSIAKNGYVDCPKWDTNLNGGEGGFVYGNGRQKAVVMTLKQLHQQGKEPPKGIGRIKETGEWAVPVKFGVDSDSESAAKGLAIDHNNLTMMGGSFTALDISRMWDQASYLSLLGDLAKTEQMPISVNEDELNFLINQLGEQAETQTEQADSENQGGRCFQCFARPCPKCGHTWDKLDV